MKKFVIVLDIPSPYRVHLLEEMARQLKDVGIEFHAHFMSRGEKGRPESWLNPEMTFQHTYWRNWIFKSCWFNPGLIFHLLLHRPTILYVGSTYYTFTGIFISLLCGAEIKCCGAEGNTKTPGKMHGFIGWFKRLVLSRYKYIAVPGKEGMAFVALHQSLTARKMPKAVLLPNIIDERKFRPRRDWPGMEIAAMRQKLGASDHDRICIIPARLIEVKGLVPFFSIIPVDLLNGWRIVVVGRGPLYQQLMEITRARGMNAHVSILDYVPYEDMPKYYAASDLMLLPSLYDQNPLVVVEALHSALPIALTSQAGNVDEAVTEGRNGWVLPVFDQKEFVNKLRVVFSTPIERLREMGEYSKKENACFWHTKIAVGNFMHEIGVC